jgi:hypothetical protein
MKLNRFGFCLELINLNNNCVKTIFVSLYLFVRSQTSLDHLVLSSEARRYLTLTLSQHTTKVNCVDRMPLYDKTSVGVIANNLQYI